MEPLEMYTIKHKKSHFARENSFNANKLLLHAQAYGADCTHLSLGEMRYGQHQRWAKHDLLATIITIMPFANCKLCAVIYSVAESVSFTVRLAFGTSIEVFCMNRVVRVWMCWNDIHYSMHATTRLHCARLPDWLTTWITHTALTLFSKQ